MFFRRRFWYTAPSQLRAYSESDVEMQNALQTLHRKGFLKSDEDCLYEGCFEKLHELLECMQMPAVKNVEDEFRRVVGG